MNKKDWKRNKPREKTVETDAMAAEIQRLYLGERYTLREVGEMLDIGYSTIRWYTKHYDIKTRNNIARGNPEKQAEIARRIHEEHWEGKKSLRQIGQEMEISHSAMQWYTERYNIPHRGRVESMLRATDGHGFMWKGGRTMRAGYVMVKVHGHPNADVNNYVPEHRYVMAEHLGRPIRDDEIVHHINGDKVDNRVENLQVRRRRNGEEQHHGPLSVCPNCGHDLFQYDHG